MLPTPVSSLAARCPDTAATGANSGTARAGRRQKMSWVPLPWCTSKSSDRHALQAMRGQRVRGGDGDAVEQAEAHGRVGGGVVARAGAPRRRPIASRRRARRRPRRCRRRRRAARPRRSRRHHRVGIQAQAARRLARSSTRSISAGVCTRCSCSAVASGASIQRRSGKAALQGVDHRRQSRRALGVAGAGIVLQAGRMAV